METQLAILIAQAFIKYGPAVARELQQLFKKQQPSLDDWEKVFALADKSYDSYVAAPQTVLARAT